MLFALLFSFALAGAPSKPEPVGYVLRGSAQSQSYLVGYEGRYFKCTTRRVCKSLSQGVPFYAMLGCQGGRGSGWWPCRRINRREACC